MKRRRGRPKGSTKPPLLLTQDVLEAALEMLETGQSPSRVARKFVIDGKAKNEVSLRLQLYRLLQRTRIIGAEVAGVQPLYDALKNYAAAKPTFWRVTDDPYDQRVVADEDWRRSAAQMAEFSMRLKQRGLI